MGNAIAAREEFGTANRDEPLLTEGNGIETLPVPITMADRKVHVLRDKVDLLGRCGNTEINLRVGGSKASAGAQAISHRSPAKC